MLGSMNRPSIRANAEQAVVDCAACPLRPLDAFVPMSEREVEFMRSFKSGELTVSRGALIFEQGTESAYLFTLLEGFAIRYAMLPDGRRQVLNFVFKGDLLGLQGEMLGEMQHTVEAATPVRLCVFSRRRIWDLFTNVPERAYDLTWLAAREESLLGDRLVSVGQMNGHERVAHALARLYLRGRSLGMVEDGRMPLPYRQRDLADGLGLSLVHTNKILRDFRERQIVAWRERTLVVTNFDALQAEAGMEDGDLPPRPLI
jgi:CRP/FNR family transcriptional regulator